MCGWIINLSYQLNRTWSGPLISCQLGWVGYSQVYWTLTLGSWSPWKSSLWVIILWGLGLGTMGIIGLKKPRAFIGGQTKCKGPVLFTQNSKDEHLHLSYTEGFLVLHRTPSVHNCGTRSTMQDVVRSKLKKFNHTKVYYTIMGMHKGNLKE